MGYALIKDIDGSKNYALNRQIQNLVPKLEDSRVKLGSSTSFTYTKASEGVYKLSSVTLVSQQEGKIPTQPYEYKEATSSGEIVTARAGVNVDPISGVVTLGSDWDGEDVYVKMVPLVLNNYYGENCYTGTQANIPVVKVVESTYTLEVAYTSGKISAAGISNQKLITFKIKKGNQVLVNDNTATGTAVTNFKATSTSNKVTFSSAYTKISISKNTSVSEDIIPVTVTCTYNGNNLSTTFNITQNANAIESVTKASGPTSVEIGGVLRAEDYTVNVKYTNGTQSNEVTPDQISKSATTGFSSQITLNANSNIYLKVIDDDELQGVTEGIVISVTSDTPIYGDVVLPNPDTKESFRLITPVGASRGDIDYISGDEQDVVLTLPVSVQQYISNELSDITNSVTYTCKVNDGSVETISDTKTIRFNANNTLEPKIHTIIATAIGSGGKSATREFTLIQGVTETTLTNAGYSSVSFTVPQNANNGNGGISASSDKASTSAGGWHITPYVSKGNKTKVTYALFLPTENATLPGYINYSVHSGVVEVAQSATWGSSLSAHANHLTSYSGNLIETTFTDSTKAYFSIGFTYSGVGNALTQDQTVKIYYKLS